MIRMGSLPPFTIKRRKGGEGLCSACGDSESEETNAVQDRNRKAMIQILVKRAVSDSGKRLSV